MAEESTTAELPALQRVPTGVPGLDEVLHGGLPRGGSCLILGEPGTGKTTLGNQILFGRAAEDETALFVTVLAEAHDRMLLHLRSFDFFTPEWVGQRVHYLGLVDALAERGLAGGLALLPRLVREYHATLLVIDGASRFEDFALSRPEYRRFSAEMHAQLALLGCTTLLLAQPGEETDALHTIGTHVDGIILLEDRNAGIRPARVLRVLKLRGSNILRGSHEFAITDAGIAVFPRLEAAFVPVRSSRRTRQQRHPFGIPGLDAMLSGGVLTGSSTLVLGPPGIGKTTAGLHFVAEGASRGERGLIAGFQEAPERLVTKADGLGLDLGGHVEAGRVRIGWQPSSDRPLDAWVSELLDIVSEHRPQRLLVDALTDVARLATDPARLPSFLTSLTHILRGQGVTTLFTSETPTSEGATLDVPLPEASATLDNAILLRYVEPRSRLHRLISVLRVRESGFDADVREFTVSDHGIEVDTSSESAEAVLADVAHLPSAPAQTETESGGEADG